MTFPIVFQKKTTYDSFETGFTIKAVLRFGNSEIACDAKIDTGSQYCLFTRILADALETDVGSGIRETFSTLGGSIVAYAHEIELETLGIRFQSYVYFAENYSLNRNLLGRQGWLQLVKLGLVDYENEIYLSPNQG